MVQTTATLAGAEQPGKSRRCRDDTGAVQGDEPAIQKRMPNIKKIPETVEIMHAVGQGQVPNIAKTDEISQAQFVPRQVTTNSCAETVPNAQDIQIGMLQRSAVRERSGGYAPCEGQACAIQTRRKQPRGCRFRKWRIAPHFDPPPDARNVQVRDVNLAC